MATMRGSDPRGNRARSVVRPPWTTRGRPTSSSPGIGAATPLESLAPLPSPAGQGPPPSRLRPPSARSHATPRSSTAWPRASAPGMTLLRPTKASATGSNGSSGSRDVTTTMSDTHALNVSGKVVSCLEDALGSRGCYKESVCHPKGIGGVPVTSQECRANCRMDLRRIHGRPGIEIGRLQGTV